MAKLCEHTSDEAHHCCAGIMPEGPRQNRAREDSVSLSDSGKEPSGDSDYMQPKHQPSADSDFTDDSTLARNRCCACETPLSIVAISFQSPLYVRCIYTDRICLLRLPASHRWWGDAQWAMQRLMPSRKRKRQAEDVRERPDNEMTRKLRPAQGEEEEDIPGNEDDAHAPDLEDLQTGPPGTLLI